MSNTSTHIPPFDVLVENRPGMSVDPDVAVIIRTPAGSYYLLVDAVGNTRLSFDTVPGLDDVEQTVLYDGNAPTDRDAELAS